MYVCTYLDCFLQLYGKLPYFLENHFDEIVSVVTEILGDAQHTMKKRKCTTRSSTYSMLCDMILILMSVYRYEHIDLVSKILWSVFSCL